MAKRKKAAKVFSGTTIQNCHFEGVHWDAKAIATIQTVADALLNLTHLFRSQGIDRPMIEIRDNGVKLP